MARCQDCAKFVSYDTETDPEVENVEISDDGTVTATVRIHNDCAECGTEMTETTFDIDEQADVADHAEDSSKCSLTVEEDLVERAIKTDGQGRWTRTYYGAHVIFNVECTCGYETTVDWTDYIQASGMDPLY